MLKRFFDILLSLAMLLILSPLLFLVALLVVAGDGFPIFFSQTRVGQNFRPFRIWKFRTMRDARDGESITSFGDPRITTIGKMLRSTKLDELPQLWNVLIGDMSFVGPRPELSEFVEAFRERYARILQVRPGITDPASIVFVDEELILAQSEDPMREYRERVLPEKLTLAEHYVERHSMVGDIAILLRTVFTVVGR
jgi:lipopolysaccharide/colanic/teichoic acid biosynthesis glycosyltransferase